MPKRAEMAKTSVGLTRVATTAARGQETVAGAWKRLRDAATVGLKTTTTVIGEAYNSALDWKDNGELSCWLARHFSHQAPTPGSKAMDAEYLHTHIGGGWHRLYDGGHSLAGSWKVVTEALPDLNRLDQIGAWANEYWKDLITTNGMPIVIVDYAQKIIEYMKHFDCVNVAQLIGDDFVGVSIFCNWDEPEKLAASAASSDCSGFFTLMWSPHW